MKTEICTVNQFDGGYTREPRGDSNAARIAKFFDIAAYPKKLKPFEDLTADGVEATIADYKITTMALGTEGYLYGLGVESGTTRPQVFYKTLPGFAWTGAPGTNHSASTSARDEVFFTPYGQYIFGGHAGGIWKYGPINGAPLFVYNDSGSAGIYGNGFVHPKDGYLYVVAGLAYTLWRNTDPTATTSTAWGSAAVLTLPKDYTIVSLCDYGDYLAIGCNRLSGGCAVFLWDRNSSLTTVSEILNWGEGTLGFIENMGGIIAGVSIISTASGSTASIAPRVMFKRWAGGAEVETFAWFYTGSTPTVPHIRHKYGDYVYFLMQGNFDGTSIAGCWTIHREEGGRLKVYLQQRLRNDVDINASGNATLLGVYRWDDYFHFAYTNTADSSKYTIWRTISATYVNATAIYETVINPGMSLDIKANKKKLMGVQVLAETLTSGQTFTIKYRVDSNTTTAGSWTTIGTYSTVGGQGIEWSDAAGTPFTEGNEYEFRIESTGGAQITSLKYKVITVTSLL